MPGESAWGGEPAAGTFLKLNPRRRGKRGARPTFRSAAGPRGSARVCPRGPVAVRARAGSSAAKAGAGRGSPRSCLVPLPGCVPWGCAGASCACNRRLEARSRQATRNTCRSPHGCWWLGSRNHGSPSVFTTCLSPWKERGHPAGRCRAAGERAL